MNYEKESVSLGLLKKKMTEFANERDYDKFHSPWLWWGKLGSCQRYFSGEERCQRSYRTGKKMRSNTWGKSSWMLFYTLWGSLIFTALTLGKLHFARLIPMPIKYLVYKTNLYNESSQSHCWIFLSGNHFMAVKSIEDFWWVIFGAYMPIFLFDPLCSHIFTKLFFFK